MKKLFYFMMIAAVLVATSCSKDDDDDQNTPAPTESELKGTMTEDLTLDASITYKLVGALVMTEGTKLTIPAGTVIEATEVSATNPDVRYIAISQGAEIDVQGTADNPVVMTSTKKETEAWGGLVICGYAPQNKAGSAGGSSTSEVGELPYGGSDANDNSGSIKYLRIEYTGYKYTNEKEFNGISFFGVGAGTTVQYIVSYMGGDDGFEFFGGTVNPEYCVSVGSGDDGMDFADGFSGHGKYWYVYNSAKSGIEGSNNGDNGASTVPMTNATLEYLTIYAMGEKPWYLKEGAGMQSITNCVIGGLADNKQQAYFFADLDDASAMERISNGDVVVTDVAFTNMGVNNTVKAVEGLTFTENADATGAGNGVQRPDWLSDALNTASNGNKVVPDDIFVEAVVDLPTGVQTSDLSLEENTLYKLNGALVMSEGTTLTIPAGTVIEATPVSTANPDVRYIAIASGAQIIADGTADAPIVMTATNRELEAWGGLVICGNAPQNKAGTAGGSSTSEVGDLPYGGSDANDNSGTLRYVRVEYTGYKYTNEKEFNGVSFFGVGAGTTVEYVSSYMGGDDGLEFFGGTVNPSYIVSIGSGDDGIDFADGFGGTGMNWYVENAAKSAIEGSNNGDNGASNVPMTNATVSNLTLMGCGEKPWYLKEGAGMQAIDNVVIGGLTNPEKAPYFFADTDDASAMERIANNDITVTNVLFYEIGDVAKAVEGLSVGENENATGAGNGAEMPEWANGWSKPSKK
jgi:hypothetical protein